MFKLRKTKKILIKKIDQLNEILTKSNIQELVTIIGSKKQILKPKIFLLTILPPLAEILNITLGRQNITPVFSTI